MTSKGWIRFAETEVAQPKGGEWHRIVDVKVEDKALEWVTRTACHLVVRTTRRASDPGYGARICDPCLRSAEGE